MVRNFDCAVKERNCRERRRGKVREAFEEVVVRVVEEEEEEEEASSRGMMNVMML